MPSVCLIAMLPLVAACNSLLETAGLERESGQEAIAPPPETAQVNPVAAPQPQNIKSPVQADAALIADIQTMLANLGYDPGPADGIMGPRTKAAVQQFQATSNMPVDGNVSPALESALQREYNVQTEVAEPPAGDPSARALKAALAEPGGRGGSDKPASTRVYGDVEQPYYEAGDKYIYSTGRVETAARTEGGLVHWVVNDGTRYTIAKNFVTPPIEWRSKSGSVEATVTTSSDVSWPPANANNVSFMATPKISDTGARLYESWSGEWTCGTEGQSTIAVPAGKFDVIRIACEKTTDKSSERHRRVWHYAPAIRHYVRKEESTFAGGQPSVADLVAVRPGRDSWSRSASSGFNWAIQKLLERGAVGQSVAWDIGDNGIEFDITVTGQTTTRSNVVCRRYRLDRKNPGKPRMFPALACRDGVTGRWKIPGLEKGSIMPADVIASR